MDRSPGSPERVPNVSLNSQYPSIKFTLDIGGSTVNFLDLSISEKYGLIEFGIYRKDTTTDIVVLSYGS